MQSESLTISKRRRSLLLKQTVWERYQKERPPVGPQFEMWCDDVAAELGITSREVANAAAEHAGVFTQALEQAARIKADEVANLCGLTLESAFRTVREALSATKRTYKYDKSGNPRVGEDGEQLVNETPDWPTRLKAADMAISLHPGARAPQQIEVDHRHLIANATDAELIKQYDELNASINEMRRYLAGETRKSIAGPRGTEGEDRGEESLVLVDGVYQNEGRAGQGESVQTVPPA